MTDGSSDLSPRERERLRQETETFETLKSQDAKWFRLQLIMGRTSVIVLPIVLVVSGIIIFDSGSFSDSARLATAPVILADIIGFYMSVGRVLMGRRERLAPVTNIGMTEPIRVSASTTAVDQDSAADRIFSLTAPSAVAVPSSSPRRMRTPQLASYAEYPVGVRADGSLFYRPDYARALAQRLVREANQYAAYELIYLVDTINTYGATLDQDGPALDPHLLERLRAVVPEDARSGFEAERDGVVTAVSSAIHGLGAMFRHCAIEFVLHDVRNPIHSVISIEESITGRTVFSSNTNFGLSVIRKYAHDRIAENFTAYRIDINGRPIKSSTLPVLDGSGHLVAVFCVNMDIGWESELDRRGLPKKLHDLLSALRATDQTGIREIIHL
ncbi:YheO-like PAS domain-containing protein [Streptomyces sp. DvalAA-14]|uniref:PAS domain-containing protein n=1 Tax=unclassified Streptomyces TaxID=2593676 RepID=UPI00081AF06E|nr:MULTISPECIES: PAS domain-containing protein [unclassified Streptomyces]MYS21559.1 hypothetical protein [Streptomyces sp. SID4948]SCD95644.1 YheO-like PAS domain-containing protein [Streptomyces sp. DvalAA-14]